MNHPADAQRMNTEFEFSAKSTSPMMMRATKVRRTSGVSACEIKSAIQMRAESRQVARCVAVYSKEGANVGLDDLGLQSSAGSAALIAADFKNVCEIGCKLK
jgi:hypothetical protein